MKKRALPACVDLDALLAQPLVPLDFVLPGLVRGTVGSLVSPGGVGKSFWALQVAVAMSTGSKGDLTGLQPPAGRVLMLSKEDPLEVLQHRLRAVAWELPRSVNFAQLDYRSCLGMSVDVMEESWFEALCEAASGARLLVLDTLTRFHSLDENSTQDMNRLLAQLERLAARSGAAVLFLHHTSKAAVLSGQGTLQQAARGSSVLVDNARWVAFLAVMTEPEARQFGIPLAERAQYVRWNISKQNYGAAMPDVWYRRGEGGVLGPVKLEARKASTAALHDSITPSAVATGVMTPLRDIGSPDTSLPAGPGNIAATGLSLPDAEGYALPERKRPAKTAFASLPSATGAFGGNW